MCVRRWGKGGLVTRQDERTDKKRSFKCVIARASVQGEA